MITSPKNTNSQAKKKILQGYTTMAPATTIRQSEDLLPETR